MRTIQRTFVVLFIFASFIILGKAEAMTMKANTAKTLNISMSSWEGIIPQEIHLQLSIDGKLVLDKTEKISSFGDDHKPIDLGDYQGHDGKISLEINLPDQNIKKNFEIEIKTGSYVLLGWENTGLLATALYVRQQDSPFLK